LNRRLRPQRAEVIEGCGHFPMLEDPDAVTAIIDELLRSLDSHDRTLAATTKEQS
jgi:pimeloyl-ACP methyl ester carboxylesterase